MKAIVKLSVGCVALTVTLGAVTAFAGPHPITNGANVGVLLFGQSVARSDATSREKADDWLRQARRAMKEGKLDLAQYYLERAERLNVSYDALFAKFVDTPKKVRQDLAKLRANPAAVAAPARTEQSGRAVSPRAGPLCGALLVQVPASPPAK